MPTRRFASPRLTEYGLGALLLLLASPMPLATAHAEQAPVAPDDDGAPPPAAETPPPDQAPPPPSEPSSPRPQADSRASATVVVRTSPRWQRPSADRGAEPRTRDDDDDERSLHGFRLGYVVLMNHDKPRDPGAPETSPERELDLQSPHQFVIGYELARRMRGEGEWLNILLVGNVMVSGLEQSRFMPTMNLLVGFELAHALQLGVGVNLAPVDVKPAHMIVAAGWTPRSGELYLPVHFFFIPDVDGHHRAGITLGVNWAT